MQNTQTIPPGELHTIRLFDDLFGGKQGVAEDKIRQVSMIQSCVMCVAAG